MLYGVTLFRFMNHEVICIVVVATNSPFQISWGLCRLNGVAARPHV